MERELRILEKFVADYHDFSTQIKNLYTLLPDSMKSYINPVDVSDEELIEKWKMISYEPKQMLEMQPSYITERGEYVRSKSELNIANTLNKYNIPYKYECPLELRKGLIIYPDFTVLNIKRRSVYYWEHRGMMDDRDYAKHTVQRLRDYGKAGIYPGKGLIISEETSTNPLGSRDIIDIIHAYFEI